MPARPSVGATEEAGDAPPFFCIVGHGQIAEFPSLDAAAVPAEDGGGANVTLTATDGTSAPSLAITPPIRGPRRTTCGTVAR